MVRLWIAVILLTLSASSDAQTGGGGGQTKANESGWTVDTLKAHYSDIAAKDDRILALLKELREMADKHASELRSAADVRYEQRFQSQENATAKATANQNEFRGSLNDLSTTKMPRTEFDVAIESVKQQIADGAKTTDIRLQEIQRRLDIKEGGSEGITNFIVVGGGIILVIMAVMAYILSTRRRQLPVARA